VSAGSESARAHAGGSKRARERACARAIEEEKEKVEEKESWGG